MITDIFIRKLFLIVLVRRGHGLEISVDPSPVSEYTNFSNTMTTPLSMPHLRYSSQTRDEFGQLQNYSMARVNRNSFESGLSEFLT
jgi:hypothetical protein